MTPTLLPDLREARTKPIYEQKSLLSAQDLQALRSELPSRRYGGEEDLFTYNAQADALHFVVSGCVLNYEKMSTGKVLAFDRIPPGGFFGEVGALYGGFRTAAAWTLEPTEVLVLKASDLEGFLQRHPRIGRLLMQGMAERLSRSGKELAHAPLRDLDLTQPAPRALKDQIILAAGNFLGSGGFLVLFFALMGLWMWAHHARNFDPNVVWVALALSVVQIVISNLVLKSQLHAARLESRLIEREREANLIAEQEIHNLYPKLDDHIQQLTTRLDEIWQRLDNGQP